MSRADHGPKCKNAAMVGKGSRSRLADDEVGRADALARIPGDASVAELFRSTWTYTSGVRRWFLVLIPLGLMLLVLSTSVPWVVGRSLDAAINERTSQAGIERYLDLRRALTASAIAAENPSEIGEPLVLLLRTDYTESMLDGLFAGGRSLQIDSGEVQQVLERGNVLTGGAVVAVQVIIEDDLVERAEIEALAGLTSDGAAAVLQVAGDLPQTQRAQAFDALASVLIDDPELGAERRRKAQFDLARILGLFSAIIIGVFVLRTSMNHITMRVTQHAGSRLRRAVFEKVHDTALLDAGAIGRPSMVSRCSSYIDTVESALRSAMATGIQVLAGLALSLVVLTVIDTTTGVLIATAVLVLELLRRRRAAAWSRTATRRLDANTSVSEYVDAAVAYAPALRMIHAQGAVRARFAAHAKVADQLKWKVSMTGYRLDLVTSTVGLFGILVVVAVVGLARGEVPLAAATAAVLYVGRVADSLAALPALIATLQEAAPNQRKLLRILRTPPLRADPAGDVRVGDATEMSLHEVSWRPPNGSHSIRRVSLRAGRGAWTIMIGPEGSGASEVIALVAGVASPDEGRIAIGKQDLAQLTRRELARCVAVVPRDPVALPGTLSENLCLGLNELPSDDAMRAALEVVGLGSLMKAAGGLNATISTEVPMGRESRVRLGFARLLLHPAPIAVIDDPTHGIDPEVSLALWAAVRRSLTDRVVLVGSRRLDLLGTSDQIIVMRTGTVVERGLRSQLVAAGGAFARLWNREHESGLEVEQLREIPGLSDLSDQMLEALARRLVSERYEDAEVILTAGTPTDRIYVVADGQVEILGGVDLRRVALLGPGDHFGEIHPDPLVESQVTARAVSGAVVRSLHRHAVSSGAAGILDRPALERSVFTFLARSGSATRQDLAVALGERVDAAVDALLGDQLVTIDEAGLVRVASALRRQRSVSLLDGLFGDQASAN
jgi:ABC-type multidrug transport system fused ATPase/permease subunit/CRP-like cAMP-binding protein